MCRNNQRHRALQLLFERVLQTSNEIERHLQEDRMFWSHFLRVISVFNKVLLSSFMPLEDRDHQPERLSHELGWNEHVEAEWELCHQALQHLRHLAHVRVSEYEQSRVNLRVIIRLNVDELAEVILRDIMTVFLVRRKQRKRETNVSFVSFNIWWCRIPTATTVQKCSYSFLRPFYSILHQVLSCSFPTTNRRPWVTGELDGLHDRVAITPASQDEDVRKHHLKRKSSKVAASEEDCWLSWSDYWR